MLFIFNIIREEKEIKQKDLSRLATKIGVHQEKLKNIEDERKAYNKILVDWSDELPALNEFREHLRLLTRCMAEGMVKDLPLAVDEPWQLLEEIPQIVQQSALKKSIVINVSQWTSLCELERFALCKLARPGHDHHNLDAAFSEVLE